MSTPTSDRPRLRVPGSDDHKYSRGKLVVVGGAMPGAAMLAALAAQRVGTGYVELLDAPVFAAPPFALVRRAWDAAALVDPRVGALVVGPGLGLDALASEKLAACLAAKRPLLLDADALTLLGRDGIDRLQDLGALALLTPHEGEFLRLFPNLTGGREERARQAAADAHAVILLKGARSIVAHPDGRMLEAPAASHWLATAGTGDVLAGIAGGLLAQGFDAFAAAKGALWLHAEAARLAGPFLIADDLIAHLPAVCAACL